MAVESCSLSFFLSFFLIFDADDFKFSPVIVEELKKDKVSITDSCLIFVKISKTRKGVGLPTYLVMIQVKGLNTG